MKDLNLNHTHMAEFGNTTRDILLKIDLENEIKDRIAGEERLSAESKQAYVVRATVSHDPKTGSILLNLYNRNDEVISSQEIDLPTEHIVTSAVLKDDLSAISFYSDPQGQPEYICDLKALVDALDVEEKERGENDAALREAIIEEARRATAAEDSLSEELYGDGEYTEGLIKQVQDIVNDLVNETADRSETDVVLDRKIDEETARAKATENALTDRLFGYDTEPEDTSISMQADGESTNDDEANSEEKTMIHHNGEIDNI